MDRHTASAAEIIVAFAQENNLARIVGEKTAGRLLSATSVKVGQGFRLALPTGAYYTWQGTVLEGTPIEPDEPIGFDWHQRRAGIDSQLEYAVDSLRIEGPTGQLKAGLGRFRIARDSEVKLSKSSVRQGDFTAIWLVFHLSVSALAIMPSRTSDFPAGFLLAVLSHTAGTNFLEAFQSCCL